MQRKPFTFGSTIIGESFLKILYRLIDSVLHVRDERF